MSTVKRSLHEASVNAIEICLYIMLLCLEFNKAYFCICLLPCLFTLYWSVDAIWFGSNKHQSPIARVTTTTTTKTRN